MRSALMKRRIRGDSTLFSFENNISCHAAEKILVGEERGMILFIDKSMLKTKYLYGRERSGGKLKEPYIAL